MKLSPERVSSGIPALDRALDELRAGDNVIWYDTQAGCAEIFLLSFLQNARHEGRHLVYLSFDRSPAALMSMLGSLTDYPKLTIIDCFTWGKGAGARPFLDFYESMASSHRCRFVTIEQPQSVSRVARSTFAVCGDKASDLRLVFDSCPAAAQIWNGDEGLRDFYSACRPRLFDQGALTYWISSRESVSRTSQAMINRTAQVVIDLELKRGLSSFHVVKASRRESALVGTSIPYRVRDGRLLEASFDQEGAGHEFGRRLRALRSGRGFSQSDLAKAIGVTPSTISQIESGSCYPSVQALLKVAEVIGPGSGMLLEPGPPAQGGPVFPWSRAEQTPGIGMSPSTRTLIPAYLSMGNPVHTVRLEPGDHLEGHLSRHQGPELLVVLQGKVLLLMDELEHMAQAGDSILIHQNRPTRWWNPGGETARMLLILLRTA